MIKLSRRALMVKAVALAAVSVPVMTMSRTAFALASSWPKKAFAAKSLKEGLEAMFPGLDVLPGDRISFLVPDIAENGAVVPIEISTDYPDAERIVVFAETNPNPLAFTVHIMPGMQPVASTRIRLAKTGNLTAVVLAGGKLYATSRVVKVTIGGCGG